MAIVFVFVTSVGTSMDSDHDLFQFTRNGSKLEMDLFCFSNLPGWRLRLKTWLLIKVWCVGRFLQKIMRKCSIIKIFMQKCTCRCSTAMVNTELNGDHLYMRLPHTYSCNIPQSASLCKQCEVEFFPTIQYFLIT